MTAGDEIGSLPSASSVVRTIRSSSIVPRSIATTGVAAAMPASRSSAAMAPRRPTPIKMTMVAPEAARCRQPTEEDSTGSCPLTTTTARETPRWVTGTPASAGSAKADETPGTTSKSRPAARSASASSPPRPNKNGSPPLSRTMTFPVRPSATSTSLIVSWCVETSPPCPSTAGRLPTSMIVARGEMHDRISSPTNRSVTTTSASASSSAARRVNRSRRPGPAPTR